MYTHKNQILSQGPPLSETGKALILVHGRGATAASILSLAEYLPVEAFTLFAPQATNQSWYPCSFMAPVAQNQPALDSALGQLEDLVNTIKAEGIGSEQIYLLGFSQGACLVSEFATRNAKPFGGLILFTGGLIGQRLDESNYKGQFGNTPVLITTGDPDPHVPVSRVEETVHLMQQHGAQVTKKIYKGRPHTITEEELSLARHILDKESK